MGPFKKDSSKFADVYLASVRDYNDLLATILFLKHHPVVNENLLDLAISITLRIRKDTSFDLPNPMEVSPHNL